jgi:four helix bundle protein
MFYAVADGVGARTYRELQCWQLASELRRRVFAILATPPANRDFKFCDQLRDSARGGPRAIAEGFGRFRPTEFARYLEFARASLMETQSHLDDALDCGYITQDSRDELMSLADRAIGATTNLHRYLRNKRQIINQ